MVQCGANTQLLHVFQEDFILGYKPQRESEESSPSSGEGTLTCTRLDPGSTLNQDFDFIFLFNHL